MYEAVGERHVDEAWFNSNLHNYRGGCYHFVARREAPAAGLFSVVIALHRTAALARAMGLTGPDERGIVIDTDNMLLGDASVELVGTVAVSRARPKFKCL